MDMTLTPEQVIAANKANLETLIGLTNKAFAGVEQLVELNLVAAKSALSDSQKNAQAALSIKDAQELLALQASLFQPLAEKVVEYNRHLYEIATGTGGHFQKAAEGKLVVLDNAALPADAKTGAVAAKVNRRATRMRWSSPSLVPVTNMNDRTAPVRSMLIARGNTNE